MTSTPGIIKDIDLNSVDIGTAQVRTDLTTGIEDLAAKELCQGCHLGPNCHLGRTDRARAKAASAKADHCDP